MEHIEVTDEWLYKHMSIVDHAMIESIEKQVNQKHKFSSEFKKKMKILIRKEKYYTVEKWLQKAVCIVTLIGLLFSVTFSVEANRTKFFETIKTIKRDSYIYSYSPEKDMEKNQIKEPQYLPKGYEFVSKLQCDDLLELVYQNESNMEINLKQRLISEDIIFKLDSKYNSDEYLSTNGMEIHVFRYEDKSLCAYLEYESSIYVLNADQLSNEELIKIFSGWVK